MLQNFRLPGDRQIVLTVDHRFALSNPALVSAPSKKLIRGAARPLWDRNGQALDCGRKGAADTILVACDPVKKPGPWAVARLESGDAVSAIPIRNLMNCAAQPFRWRQQEDWR